MRQNAKIEKWYLEELKRKAKPTFLQRIGLVKSFLNRKKKSKFSVVRFIKYIKANWQ